MIRRTTHSDRISDPLERFLSREACLALLARAESFSQGGGTTGLSIESTWMGNLRWARNQIISSGDLETHDVWLTRNVRGANVEVIINAVDDITVWTAIRRAERLLVLQDEAYPDTPLDLPAETYPSPAIWSDTTYNLDASARAEVAHLLVQPAVKAGMLAAGYVQVTARGRTVLDSTGRTMYYPYTQAQYSVTVRNPKGTGSGWAGVDWHDWDKVDADTLTRRALDKCVQSQNPVRLEPGRYTAILEPQAVCDLFDAAVAPRPLWRMQNETKNIEEPYANGNYQSKIGERLLDERLTVTADPMDPELGFVPFDRRGNVYRPVTWFERGVLKDLSYDRDYAVRQLGQNEARFNSGAYRMTGGTTSIDEMIATTKRGVLVTRFSNISKPPIDEVSLLLTGYTRDGLWLIENGKISKPIMNFRFTESPLFVLNNVEQMGVPQRVFHPDAPVVVPSLKIKDFNFSSLADAV